MYKDTAKGHEQPLSQDIELAPFKAPDVTQKSRNAFHGPPCGSLSLSWRHPSEGPSNTQADHKESARPLQVFL